MKAKLPEVDASNARNYSDKEVIRRIHAIGLVKGAMRELIDCRLYMSRSGDGASPVYCSLWITGGDRYTSGAGRANGYGYHKASAAVSDAISSAGIRLDERIDGIGDSAINDALTAIATACGAESVLIVGN